MVLPIMGERRTQGAMLRMRRARVNERHANGSRKGQVRRSRGHEGLARSLDFLFFAQRAPILPDHTYFLATETCVLDRHSEEQVFAKVVCSPAIPCGAEHALGAVRTSVDLS